MKIFNHLHFLVVIECPSRPEFTSDEIKGCARDYYHEINECKTEECPYEGGCEIRSIGGDCKLKSSTVCYCNDKMNCNSANEIHENSKIGVLIAFLIISIYF